jgi:hypothetical protein
MENKNLNIKEIVQLERQKNNEEKEEEETS